MKHRVVVATYNVHRCIGSDRRHEPERIASVLTEIGADIVGLQEVSTRAGDVGDIDQLATLAEAAGMHSTAGPTLVSARGHIGNALLSRWPILGARKIDLSVTRREPRGAIDADLEVEGRALRVVVTHLGLRPGERLKQVERLLAALDVKDDRPTLILADANEWRPLVALRRRLRHFAYRSLPTFPAVLPILALDLVMVRPALALREVAVHRSAIARRASDHLPVRAVLDLAATEASDGSRPRRGRR